MKKTLVVFSMVLLPAPCTNAQGIAQRSAAEWYLATEALAADEEIPCSERPTIPIFYKQYPDGSFDEASIQSELQVLGAGQEGEACPPEEPPIPIFIQDPEGVRKRIEVHRLSLEAFRAGVEKRRSAGELDDASYSKAMAQYREGMFHYWSAIFEYQSVLQETGRVVVPE